MAEYHIQPELQQIRDQANHCIELTITAKDTADGILHIVGAALLDVAQRNPDRLPITIYSRGHRDIANEEFDALYRGLESLCTEYISLIGAPVAFVDNTTEYTPQHPNRPRQS